MLSRWQAALAAFVLVAGVPRGARAQIDYRNLDDDRPTLVEDAYPVERFAFEFLAPYRVERGRGGRTVHAFIPELEFGLLRNLQVGLKAPIAGTDAPGTSTTWGLSGLRVFALYNFNTESPALPAIALRLDGFAPVGSHGGAGGAGSVKAIATRSFGRNRVHLNGALGLGRPTTRATIEGGERWWYGAAVDRTLFRHSVLVVAEIVAIRPEAADRVAVNTAVGLRWQWNPVTVLDLGLTRGLRRGLGPDIGVTFGLSRAFGIRALMPRARPDASPMSSGGADAHRH